MPDFSKPDPILDFIRNLDFPYYRGGIFPSEMALFLYRCEQAGVKCIIESGRGEGYSTAVISAYGQARQIQVVSMDWEADSELAKRCKERLARFPDLKLVTGDAFNVLPTLLHEANGPIGLLIDGPKYDDAIYLSVAAAAYASVRVIAHHNSPPDTPWYRHFGERFPQAHRVEDSELINAKDFDRFRAWERQIAKDTPGRNVDDTSLVVSALPQAGPARGYLRGPSFRQTLAPTAVYWSWKLGLPAGSIISRGRQLLARMGLSGG
jgi:predicted O-methyltransferase YrrM